MGEREIVPDAENSFVPDFAASESGSLEANTAPLPAALGRRKRMRRREERRTSVLTRLNGQIYTVAIGGWALTHRLLVLSQPALISCRHQCVSKATAHGGWLSFPLPMLLIRGGREPKGQLGNPSLALPGTSWDGFKGRKAICSFCVEGHRVWGSVPVGGGAN